MIDREINPHVTAPDVAMNVVDADVDQQHCFAVCLPAFAAAYFFDETFDADLFAHVVFQFPFHQLYDSIYFLNLSTFNFIDFCLVCFIFVYVIYISSLMRFCIYTLTLRIIFAII